MRERFVADNTVASGLQGGERMLQSVGANPSVKAAPSLFRNETQASQMRSLREQMSTAALSTKHGSGKRIAMRHACF